MAEETKQRIVEALRRVYPCDLSITEIAGKVGISDITAAKYVSVLEAEGKIELSRRIGKAKLFKLRGAVSGA